MTCCCVRSSSPPMRPCVAPPTPPPPRLADGAGGHRRYVLHSRLQPHVVGGRGRGRRGIGGWVGGLVGGRRTRAHARTLLTSPAHPDPFSSPPPSLCGATSPDPSSSLPPLPSVASSSPPGRFAVAGGIFSDVRAPRVSPLLGAWGVADGRGVGGSGGGGGWRLQRCECPLVVLPPPSQ